jgi:hypothetical protein
MSEKRIKFLILAFICISILNSIAPPENEVSEIIALFYNYLNLTFDIMITLEIIPHIYNYFEV